MDVASARLLAINSIALMLTGLVVKAVDPMRTVMLAIYGCTPHGTGFGGGTCDTAIRNDIELMTNDAMAIGLSAAALCGVLMDRIMETARPMLIVRLGCMLWCIGWINLFTKKLPLIFMGSLFLGFAFPLILNAILFATATQRSPSCLGVSILSTSADTSTALPLLVSTILVRLQTSAAAAHVLVLGTGIVATIVSSWLTSCSGSLDNHDTAEYVGGEYSASRLSSLSSTYPYWVGEAGRIRAASSSVLSGLLSHRRRLKDDTTATHRRPSSIDFGRSQTSALGATAAAVGGCTTNYVVQPTAAAAAAAAVGGDARGVQRRASYGSTSVVQGSLSNMRDAKHLAAHAGPTHGSRHTVLQGTGGAVTHTAATTAGTAAATAAGTTGHRGSGGRSAEVYSTTNDGCKGGEQLPQDYTSTGSSCSSFTSSSPMGRVVGRPGRTAARSTSSSVLHNASSLSPSTEFCLLPKDDHRVVAVGINSRRSSLSELEDDQVLLQKELRYLERVVLTPHENHESLATKMKSPCYWLFAISFSFNILRMTHVLCWNRATLEAANGYEPGGDYTGIAYSMHLHNCLMVVAFIPGFLWGKLSSKIGIASTNCVLHVVGIGGTFCTTLSDEHWQRVGILCSVVNQSFIFSSMFCYLSDVFGFKDLVSLDGLLGLVAVPVTCLVPVWSRVVIRALNANWVLAGRLMSIAGCGVLLVVVALIRLIQRRQRRMAFKT